MMLMKLMICSVLIFLIQTSDVNGNPQTCQQCSCHQCTSDIQPHIVQPNTLIRGKAGPKGIKGEEGHHGKKGEPGQDFDSALIKELYMKIRQLESDSNQIKQMQNQINQLESELNQTKEMQNKINQLESELNQTKQMEDRINELESELNQTKQMEDRINQVESKWNEIEQKKPGNCSQIKEYHPDSTSGIYRIYENFFDQVGREVSCDMTSEGVEMFHNCKEILDAIPSASDGVYRININPSTIIDVMCDMTGCGWTVFQKRFDGSENFRRSFNEYSVGFGHPSQEHWLGLNNIHELTSQPGRWTLRVELQRYDGETAYAQYEDFSVGAGTDYILSVGTHSGTAGDALVDYSNGHRFSAFDKDQDRTSGNCASDGSHNGAWWWSNCGYSNLNSYTYGNIDSSKGMEWRAWKNGKYSSVAMQRTEMKIKQL